VLLFLTLLFVFCFAQGAGVLSDRTASQGAGGQAVVARRSVSRWSFACGLLQGESRSCFELSDQKARGFLVQIALTRRFLEHARKVFGEISVRI
jgi:hypothetical protein